MGGPVGPTPPPRRPLMAPRGSRPRPGSSHRTSAPSLCGRPRTGPGPPGAGRRTGSCARWHRGARSFEGPAEATDRERTAANEMRVGAWVQHRLMRADRQAPEELTGDPEHAERPRPERPAGPGHFPPGDREGSFVPAVTEAPLDHAEGCAGDRGPGSAWCHDLWPVDGSSSAGKSSKRRRRPSPHGSNVLRASDEMSSSSSVTGCWSAAPGVAARRGPDRRPGVWPPSRWSVRVGSPVPSGPGRLWP